MPFIKIWVHCVWGTKNRFPFLKPELKQELIKHIFCNAKNKGIHIKNINGAKDHLHCLISLESQQSISKIVQMIKGESSYWINNRYNKKLNFSWAEEYFAMSVSESNLNLIDRYIKNQEQHHQKKTWQEEYTDFMEEYGFKK